MEGSPAYKSTTLQDLIQYIEHGAVDQVKIVLKRESNLKTQKNIKSLAKAAVKAGKKDIIVTLLKHGLNVNTALDLVINSGKDDLIKFMLDRGADINDGLYFAVKANNKDAITILLELGANINTNKINGKTPLHTALMQKLCDLELVEFLIKKGADTRVKTKNNKTALDLFRRCHNVKHDAETKNKNQNIEILLRQNKKDDTFECIMGLPDGRSSYQTKLFTLYAIMNTKQAISGACQFELRTEVKDLVPFDAIYSRKIQEGRTSCEFIQFKQTKKPESNKISPSQFFSILKPECKVKEHIKGNDSIVKIFLKFNETLENNLDINTSGVFILCENTTFQDDPSPCLKRTDAVLTNSVLCLIKHDQWIIDKNHLFIEIKYVLLNLIKTSPYFSIMDDEIKTTFNKRLQILDKCINEKNYKTIDDEILSSTKNVAMEGLSAIQIFLKYLCNCKREIKNAIDIENVKRNFPAEFELPFTDDLAFLIKRAVFKINKVSKSFRIDRKMFSYFSKFDDDTLREKIDNFVKNFSIYTDCPTSDELEELITKEISDEIKFDIPDHITTYCVQYFSKWIINFKNGEGNVFTDRHGRDLFNDIKMRIFKTFNKPYIEELERTKLNYRQNNEQVIEFLNKDNNYKILHVITQHTRLHTVNIFQTIKNLKEQSTNLDHLNNVVCTSLANIIKSDAHLKFLFDVFNSEDSSDLLILECLEDIDVKRELIVVDYLQNISTINAIKKLIIIAKNQNELTAKLKNIKDHTSCKETLSFEDLTDESQKYILEKTVKFRNNPNSLITQMKVENFIKRSSACEVIDECLLSTIVTNTEDIQIGNENAFLSDQYDAKTFIPRYLLNLDVSILQECFFNLFFITGITLNALITKFSLNKHSIYIWERDKVYNNGIVLMPHSHNVTSQDIFKSLLSDNKNCYWLKFDGELLYFYEVNISEEYEKCKEQIAKHHKLAIENLEDKVVILANDAGEGKSTVLTHLAQCMRKKSSNSWIIRVDFKNDAESNILNSLNNIIFGDNDITKAVELITHTVVVVDSTDGNNKLERKLLEAVLNGHSTIEIVLLFDGFDEICPCFKEKTCNLLKALAISNIKQLWVTTRVHLKEYLEEELGVQAHMLAGFSEFEQIQFMSNSWKWQFLYKLTEKESNVEIVNQLRILFNNLKVSMNNYNYLLKYLEKCSLLELKRSINHEIDFQMLAKASLKLWEKSQKTYDLLKIPLHVKILANICTQRQWEPSIFSNSLLFGIYTEFVKTKLEIYDNKSNNTKSNQYASDQVAGIVKERFKQMHHEIAVTTLPFTLTVLPSQNICSKYSNILQEITRVGLVKCYGSRVEFIHRTFAEYFFSEYLVTHLDNPDVQTEFLENILNNDDYHLLRTFFDEFLLQYQERDIAGYVKSFENILIPSISEKIINLKNNNDNVLHVASREGHFQIFLLILKNIPKNIFAKLILENSHEGCSMLQLSIKSGHTAMSKAITNMKSIERSLLAKLIMKRDNYGRTALHLAAEKDQSCVCKSIIDAAKACTVFEKLILCVDLDKNTALHYAGRSSNRDVIQVIVKSIEANYNLFKELIQLINKDGQNVLHIAARFNRVDANCVILKSVNKDMLECIITQCDINDENVLRVAVSCYSINICKLLLETAEKHDLLNELIMKSSINKKTILHIAADRCDEPLCSLILKTVKDRKDLINYLIIKQDDNGQTALHIATYYREAGICDVILKTVKDYKEDLRTVIMQRDNRNSTALEMATKSNDDAICYMILNYAVKHEDIFRDIIMQSDEHGWTALHQAAIHRYSKICCVILDIAKIYANVLKNLIMKRDTRGYTALELAEKKVRQELIKYINMNIASDLIQHKNIKEFGDVFISNVLQSHCALSIWLFKIKSRVKVHTHKHIRTKRCKYIISRRSALTDLYTTVLNRQSIIYEYISKVKDFNEKLKPEGTNWYFMNNIFS